MCRPTAEFERFFQEMGFRFIDQVPMLSNDCGSFCSLRFVARGEKTPAYSHGTCTDEPNGCNEPFSNELQSLVTFLRSRICSWIHAVLPLMHDCAFLFCGLDYGRATKPGESAAWGSAVDPIDIDNASATTIAPTRNATAIGGMVDDDCLGAAARFSV